MHGMTKRQPLGQMHSIWWGCGAPRGPELAGMVAERVRPSPRLKLILRLRPGLVFVDWPASKNHSPLKHCS